MWKFPPLAQLQPHHIKLGHHYARMFAKDHKNWSQDFTVLTVTENKRKKVVAGACSVPNAVITPF
jgi:hypothetical protein